MTLFHYRAARPDGAEVRGDVEAVSGPAAAATLSARGLFPLRVDDASAPRRGRRAPARAAATTMRGIAALVAAGVPLLQAVDAARTAAPGALGVALERVQARLREGASLGAAFAAEGNLFSPVTVGLVQSGERGAGLAKALDQAATQLERDAELAARVRAALAYPTVLGAVGAFSLAVIVGVVVPRFAALLTDLGQTLPPATRALIALSQGTQRFGVPALGLLGVAIALGTQVAASHRVAWHEWLLGIPVLGSIRHSLATARVGRMLGTLLGTGVPALSALAIARDAAADAAVSDRLERARHRVAEGVGLAAALTATAALTPAALHVARVAEGSGRLPELLEQAAQVEERNADGRLKAMVGLLEPLLIVAFAAVVACVASALLQAVYSVRPV